VVQAIRKLEKFLVVSADDPMYVASFKRAFSSYFDWNIQVPPVLKTCAFLDPRFKSLKGIMFSPRIAHLYVVASSRCQ